MRTKIIINDKNITRLQAVLDEAQARAKVRLITTNDLFHMVKTIEQKLNIAKADMTGIRVFVDLYAAPFCGYNGTPESTHVVLLRTSTGWALTDAYRASCQGGQCYNCTLTDRAKEAILKKHETFDY